MTESKYKISEEVAESDYRRIVELFDVDISAEEKAVIIDAIMRGLVTLDEDEETLTYTLVKPVIAGDQRLTSVTMRELTASELETINKGFTGVQKANGDTTIDVSAAFTRTIKLIVKMSGCALVLANRIKKRDFVVLQALSSFFA